MECRRQTTWGVKMDAAKVGSGQAGQACARPWPARAAAAALATLATLAAGETAAGETPGDSAYPQVSRHGTVSRHFWAPEATSTEVAGMRLSAGIAFGVRAPLRAAVGAPVTPAIVLRTGRHSNMTLLPAESGGALLVWQLRH